MMATFDKNMLLSSSHNSSENLIQLLMRNIEEMLLLTKEFLENAPENILPFLKSRCYECCIKSDAFQGNFPLFY